ncbi:MAG: phenylalanine--tRNA ligase subunit beta [Bergeyella sp.]|nr:phenylalanine--tRNA ligase subunit beta [Bergeyella sp.]
MKISNHWLREYIKTDIKIEKIGDYLTDIGLEVEGIEQYETIKGSLKGIVIGKVITCDKHPNANKLKITTVDVGEKVPLKIVCGAPNVKEGILVPVALVDTILYTKEGSTFQIKKTKIRGEISEGMICSESELHLSEKNEGIMVLEGSAYRVGAALSNYFNTYQDEVLEIGLTPNRTDAMSHYGVARDLHAFLQSHQIESQFEKIQALPMETEEESGYEIEIEEASLCPRYVGAVIENVEIKESPEELKNKLKAIGVTPINNIVDATNYILHGLGQPLHAFDGDKISGKKIKIGTARRGTLFTTLDGVEIKLKGSEIVIKDAEDVPLCMAGILGGENSGISKNTQTVFLESAYFDPVAIRKTSKLHGIHTDASFRFERGVDVGNTRTAITHAIELIEKISNGKLRGSILESYPQKIENHYVILRYSKLEQILGEKIHREKVKKILKSLDITVINEIQNGLELSVPLYRAEVTREIDVIEEILRIYGYNKIEAPGKISFTPVSLDLGNREDLEELWSQVLVGNGFFEVMNNSLTIENDPKEAVLLLNPLSRELSHMRKSLLEGLLENTIYNINRKALDIKFFEFGKVYHKYLEGYKEKKQLALLISGREVYENWLQQKSSTHFYYLKAYVSLLCERVGVVLEEFPLEDTRFSEGVALSYENTPVIKMGKVSPELLRLFDIEQECFYAELEMKEIQEMREKILKFKNIPRFNKIRRDLALLLDNDIKYSEVLRVARSNKSPFLKSVMLFDVYEGKNLPEGKKSYALSFELLNEEKTLEEKEINEVMDSLIHSFQNELSASLR